MPGAAACQICLVAAVLTLIALWPPRDGAMLMIPLAGRSAGVIDVAMDARAGLLAPGPLPGSMIVIGNRAALSGPAFGRGILLLSAPRALCGDTVQGRAG